MGLGGRIALLVMVAILVLVVLVLISDAAAKVNQVPGASEDEDLQNASRLLTWTTVACWVALAVVAIGIGMLIYNGASTAAISGGFMVNTLLIFLFLVLFIMGVMAAAAASSIEKSGQETTGDGRTAYNNCVAAAILSLTTIGLIIIGMILVAVHKKKRNRKIQQVEEAIELGDLEALEQLSDPKNRKPSRKLAETYLESVDRYSKKATKSK